MLSRTHYLSKTLGLKALHLTTIVFLQFLEAP